MSKYLCALRGKTSSLEGTLILPLHLYHEIKGIASDPSCPDNEAFVVDKDGHIHTLRYTGRLPSPGEPGYLELSPEGDPH